MERRTSQAVVNEQESPNSIEIYNIKNEEVIYDTKNENKINDNKDDNKEQKKRVKKIG